MRIYKNDIIKASAISTDDERGLLLCSITDSGFTSIAGVISAVKDKLPNKDHKKMVFEYFEARRTKVFYSQIRAMCRFYGKKNVRKYKKL